MVVSASALKSLDDTEVDIALEFAQSPAKVICHSPGRVTAAVLRLLMLRVVWQLVIYILTVINHICTDTRDGVSLYY